MAVTQKSYVNSSSGVKAARAELNSAKAALSDATKAKAGLPTSAGKDLANQIDARIADAKNKLDAANLAVSIVEDKAKKYFDTNKESINAKASAKEKTTSESNIASAEAQIARMKEAGLDTTQLEQQIAEKKNVLPKITLDGSGSSTGGTGGGKEKPEDFAGLIKTAPAFIGKMSGPERKLLAQSLNDSLGLKLPVSELIDPGTLLGAYQSAISGAQARYNTFKDILTVDQFLAQKKLETSAVNAGGGSVKPWATISNPTQAKSTINQVITGILGRDATDKEVASITKKLNQAQQANPYKQVNGITTGGVDATQFVTDLVKALPEYATKIQAKQDLTGQGIEATARANGLKLKPEEIKAYADRVKNGEDIKVIENQIRSIASLGQPDTIKKLMADGTDLETLYAPYKRTMATSLGINPDTITLDDPTLRMAIGPDKEMSLYDYQKAIRKDNRWKYSQEANDEVTNMITQVKRDFGFMG